MSTPALSDTITHGIRVGATAFYLPEESAPEQRKFLFGYRIVIANEGRLTATLRSRHWRIIDGTGKIDEVRGEGVVGQQPRLAPGGAFKYTSYCPLSTAWGTMEGEFEFETDGGEKIEVKIGRFYLAKNKEVCRARPAHLSYYNNSKSDCRSLSYACSSAAPAPTCIRASIMSRIPASIGSPSIGDPERISTLSPCGASGSVGCAAAFTSCAPRSSSEKPPCSAAMAELDIDGSSDIQTLHASASIYDLSPKRAPWRAFFHRRYQTITIPPRQTASAASWVWASADARSDPSPAAPFHRCRCAG